MEELRNRMLTHFLETRLIKSFKAKYPQYSSQEVNEMRQALLTAGDIERVWGTTRNTRYRTTHWGKQKLT